MRILSLWVLLGILVGVCTGEAHGASAPNEVSIPNTRRFEFTSKVNAHRYAVSVALPNVPCAPPGCGVLYVLDGDFYFASAAGAARLNAPGVVVVGIGYPSNAVFVKTVLAAHQPLSAAYQSMPKSQAAIELERMYDLTLPATNEELIAQRDITVDEQTSNSVGGLDDFLQTIETDVKPRVAKLVAIDSTHQAIFGHSLGGLAVLHALFVKPDSFRTFIIASPSIWWNKRAVLADEPRFSAAVRAGTATPRVLLTVGGTESTPPKVIPPSWGMSAAEVDTALQRARMVENAAELAARLKTLRGHAGYLIDYAIFDEQDHGISPWPALGRGISFAFTDGP